jgi:hypothetical protein
MNMKNLIQGQEISKWKDIGIRTGSGSGCFSSLIFIFLKLVFILFLPTVGGLGVLFIAKKLELTSDELVLGVIFSYIILIVFLLYQKYKNLEKEGGFNPSVVYYDDCLLVLKNPSAFESSEEVFLGEIPFKGIKRFVFQDGKIMKVIVHKDYMSSFSKIYNGEFDFYLHPDLLKIGLQIVDELNSKLNKETIL